MSRDLIGDITINSVRYPLKRKPEGGLAYNDSGRLSDQEDVPDILPISESWPMGCPGGFGETIRLSRDSLGFAYSDEVDASTPGVIRFRDTGVVSSATSNAITDVPTFCFLETDGTTEFVYILNGRYGYKCKTSGSAITIETEKDFGATAVCGQPAKEAGVWKIPLGSAVDVATLTTVAATGAGADTYGSLSGIKADHLCTGSQGAATVLYRALGSNVSVSNDSGVSFGSNFPCGDSGSSIEKLYQGASGVYVFKNNNAGRLVGGVWQQLTRFEEGDKNSDFGCGGFVPGGSDSFLYNHRGLYEFDGDRVREVTPGLVTGTRVSASIIPPVGLTFYECAYASDRWMYFIADRAFGGSSGRYILAWDREGQRWFTYGKSIGGATVISRGLIVDTGQRLWSLDANASKIVHFQLGKSGQPYNQGGSAMGESSGSGAFRYPFTTMGYPNVLKQLRSFEADMRGLDASNTIRFTQAIDTTTLANFGSAFTSDGVNVNYASTPLTFYGISPGLTFAVNGSGDPRVMNMTIRASLRPESLRRIDFTIQTNLKYSSDVEPEWDGPTVLSNIQALNRAAPTTFTDPGGNSVSIRIWGYDARVILATETDIHYEIDVSAYVWDTS